jgi:hypothetical protein
MEAFLAQRVGWKPEGGSKLALSPSATARVTSREGAARAFLRVTPTLRAGVCFGAAAEGRTRGFETDQPRYPCSALGERFCWAWPLIFFKNQECEMLSFTQPREHSHDHARRARKSG